MIEALKTKSEQINKRWRTLQRATARHNVGLDWGDCCICDLCRKRNSLGRKESRINERIYQLRRRRLGL